MKTKLKRCERCGEETLQDVGKKQATSRSGAYTRRTTSRCRQCGTREIVNRKRGKRTLVGRNKLPEEE